MSSSIYKFECTCSRVKFLNFLFGRNKWRGKTFWWSRWVIMEKRQVGDDAVYGLDLIVCCVMGVKAFFIFVLYLSTAFFSHLLSSEIVV